MMCSGHGDGVLFRRKCLTTPRCMRQAVTMMSDNYPNIRIVSTESRENRRRPATCSIKYRDLDPLLRSQYFSPAEILLSEVLFGRNTMQWMLHELFVWGAKHSPIMNAHKFFKSKIILNQIL